MTKFISNVNKYLSEMKIKQSYLSMIASVDKGIHNKTTKYGLPTY